jgi:2-C-methyl-D-erythritol 4-phosphate cytidylyltransferase
MLTVKAVDDRRDVRLTLDREQLWLVHTPQVFRRDWFAQALAQANHALRQFPDDAAILEAAGFQVRMVPGDPLNLKVTTKEDVMLAEAILKSRRRAYRQADR